MNFTLLIKALIKFLVSLFKFKKFTLTNIGFSLFGYQALTWKIIQINGSAKSYILTSLLKLIYNILSQAF